ncbi:MAG: DNA topoisomerase IB [Gaiellaceae bacterium]
MPRLRRADCSAPGLTRRRHGRGFGYVDEQGRSVRDPEVVERIRSLAIPPAWADVWICPDPNGHLQAVGRDQAGRRQYLYHPRWRTHRDRQKFDEMLAFAETLPSARRRVAGLLRRRGLTRERVLAFAFGLLDRGFFRIGGEEYAELNGSHGLATLERRHVRLEADGAIVFDYEGKTGRRQVQRVVDPALSRVAAELRRSRRRGTGFLAFRNGRGWVDVRSDDINAFVKELTSPEFSAKDFRTWHATVLAAVSLAASAEPARKAGRDRAIAAAVRDVAESLGNTPAVCRASYIDPRLFDHFRAGSTIAPSLGSRNAIETAVRELLANGFRASPSG